ncbi:MAG: hypothetical protein RR311_14650, partial [Comamonas sp.]
MNGLRSRHEDGPFMVRQAHHERFTVIDLVDKKKLFLESLPRRPRRRMNGQRSSHEDRPFMVRQAHHER